MIAAALLKHMRQGEALETALAAAGVEAAKPAGPEDEIILARLQKHAESGELDSELRVWKMGAADVVNELLAIASGSKTVSASATPLLYTQLKARLFIAMAHALYLESSVSKLARKERQHPNSSSTLLQHVLVYHDTLKKSRGVRLSVRARSDCGGALSRAGAKENAEAGRDLHLKARTYRQQYAAVQHALREAHEYLANDDVFTSRGDSSLRKQLGRERAQAATNKAAVSDTRVASMVATRNSTGVGKCVITSRADLLACSRQTSLAYR